MGGENTVKAASTDEVGNSGSRSDEASVTVARRPSQGGLGAVIAAGAQQARENREAAAAAQQQISPPSTGDGGLGQGSAHTALVGLGAVGIAFAAGVGLGLSRKTRHR